MADTTIIALDLPPNAAEATGRMVWIGYGNAGSNNHGDVEYCYECPASTLIWTSASPNAAIGQAIREARCEGESRVLTFAFQDGDGEVWLEAEVLVEEGWGFRMAFGRVPAGPERPWLMEWDRLSGDCSVLADFKGETKIIPRAGRARCPWGEPRGREVPMDIIGASAALFGFKAERTPLQARIEPVPETQSVSRSSQSRQIQ